MAEPYWMQYGLDMISFTFTVRPRSVRFPPDALGWEIMIQPTRNGVAHGAGYITDPIYDPTILAAEVARLTARMALGRETS